MTYVVAEPCIKCKYTDYPQRLGQRQMAARLGMAHAVR